MKKILLTSFETWLPHQKSNSSDDLLHHIESESIDGISLTFLRKLPVDTVLASQKAIAAIEQMSPHFVVCCGMAESRWQLSLESNATWENAQLHSTVNLEKLVNNLSDSVISHDAGKFVCEGLYYRVLHHLRHSRPDSHGLFVHVPVLTETNLQTIMADFRLILQEIT
jgi:pyroglutamyl-peptidase